jgi:hypothetical protein
MMLIFGVQYCSKLATDDEFVLVRVMVLKKGIDTFRAICRDRR